jgi:hypothetical protein
MFGRVRIDSIRWIVASSIAAAALTAAVRDAYAFQARVQDDKGQPITNGFRWLLEEDNSYPVTPGVPSPNAAWNAVPGNPSYTLSVNIHKSHAPVVCTGDTAPGNPAANPPRAPGWAGAPSSVNVDASNCPGFSSGKRYMFQALPWHSSPPGAPPFKQTGWTMSGRNVAPGQSTVTVIVHALPVPVGQITILVFEDNQPVNGAYDQPEEHGLANFSLIITDPIGKVNQDHFAYPLGTTYKYAHTMPDGRPADANGRPLWPEQQPEFLYDVNGLPVVDFMGDGTIKTCPGGPPSGYTPYQKANCVDPYTLQPLAAGEAVIRNLAGNKTTIEPVPPPELADMLLTATLEGSRGNDTWIRPGEPRYNIRLGQLNWLVFYGFVHPMPMTLKTPPGGMPGSITGQIVYAHDSHPPLSPGLNPGLPVPEAFVALNNLSGNDEQVFTAPCNPLTGEFAISNVPPGLYQLAIWDKAINAVMDYRHIEVEDGEHLAMGKVPVYGWFSTLTGTVFADPDGNGLPAGGIPPNPADGIGNVPINLRFTDGSLYGSTLTRDDGTYTFPQYVSFWRFLVAEVDSSRFKSTGMTATVDSGGVLNNDKWGRMGIHPQIQPGGLPYRTEASYKNGNGEVITQAINAFQDMTNRIDWGKAAYGPGENGGIRGVVWYATTRTEEDPQKARTAGWEPAVPNVTLNLYKAKQDRVTGNPLAQYWVTDGPAVMTTMTDSWNDNLPTGCVGAPNVPYAGKPEAVNGFAIPSCAETFRSWDQIREGVFDGAYHFDSFCAAGVALNTRSCIGGAAPTPIPPGNYIVQVIPPTGYQSIAWGDRNIEFGDPKIPFLTQPPACVGANYDIPQYHTLYPDQLVPTDTTVTYGPWQPGMQAPLCDKKQIGLNPGANAAVDFRILTVVPKASRIWGTVWNDLMLEFSPLSPNASGNLGLSYLPVSVKDFAGTEVARFYTDQWGHFGGLVPANYDISPPIPLGLVLAMYTIAPNDPGPILDARPGSRTHGQWITDPFFNPAYTQEVIRENWEFYAGKTTMIDTIVLPAAAFVGNRVPLNCAYTDRTPELKQVSDVMIPQSPGGYQITISSMGKVEVPNPNYDPSNLASPLLVTWDHGFGATPGAATVGGTALTNLRWAADGATISATVPNGVSGQLVVTRGDNGLATTVGVTLHLAGAVPTIDVYPPPGTCVGLDCSRIQPAIDGAPIGAIVLLHPGSYQENVNLWRPITLQGFGAAVTILDGTAATANFQLKQKQFAQVQSLLASDSIGLVPNQAANFTLEEGAGILVAGCNPSECPKGNEFAVAGRKAQIDALTITGATEAGGGVLINGFAAHLTISNCEIISNEGHLAGGIRSGEPGLIGAGNPLGSSFNPNLTIDHNRIAMNGSLSSGGGGIGLFAGSDDYAITNNFVCGNFSASYGGGVGHFGLSQRGRIYKNKIVSNESKDEGGGIHVGGENVGGANGLTQGAGSVVINANLIQGNKAGDDGGGVRTRKVNGRDVLNNPHHRDAWYRIDITNNVIVNNSSADHGGGLSFDDTARLFVINNTVARNDATSTGSGAFGGPCHENSPIGERCPAHEAIGGLTSSVPQVGGIASFAHSAPLRNALRAAGDPQTFSNPVLIANIIWQNRSFFWDANGNQRLGLLRPMPGSGYWDLAVYGAGGARMSPTGSLLTDGIGATPSPTNRIGGNAAFVSNYFNVYQATQKGAAMGNFVATMFTPNGVQGDYHTLPASRVVGGGGAVRTPLQQSDYDGRSRIAPIDIGATQHLAAAPPRQVLSATASLLSFPVGLAGTKAPPQRLVLTNLTDQPIAITRTLTGEHAGHFMTSIQGVPWSTARRTIPPKGRVTLTIRLAPTSTGKAGHQKKANLLIQANGKKALAVSLMDKAL